MSGRAALSRPSMCNASATARAISASASARFLLEALAAALAAASGPGRTHCAAAGRQEGW